MKMHNNLYTKIISIKNLILAWRKARKGKTTKDYIVKFEKDLPFHLKYLNKELYSQTYCPKPLKTFILRDPKTRKISKSEFRDRVVHHALCNIIEPIFDKTFIYDNCASRKGKGVLLALNRFEDFRRKLTNNFTSKGFCFKADIKHYFEEIDQDILLEIIKRKIKCEKTIWLVKQILQNKVVEERERDGGFFTNY
jgi:retron-type reverse transcriptase